MQNSKYAELESCKGFGTHYLGFEENGEFMIENKVKIALSYKPDLARKSEPLQLTPVQMTQYINYQFYENQPYYYEEAVSYFDIQKLIMKKLMMILVAMMVTVTVAFAQTASCKINGGTQNTTVVASITSVGDGYVMVVLDNDGDFAVNVTIKITGSGNGSVGLSPRPPTLRGPLVC